MKVLITGATGFLGLQLATDLKKKGYEVYNFSRTHSLDLEKINVQTIKGDLSKIEDIRRTLESYEFEAIFHVASKVGMWGKWEDFYNVNVLGAKNIFDEAAKNSSIKYFIYTSTPSVVFDHHSLINEDEKIPYAKNSLSLYAKSKILAEEYILNSNTDLLTCALRPHLIYGKKDKNIIPRLIEARKKNKLKIIGDGENLVDVIHVENASHAHILALEELCDNARNNKKAYFIAQEKPVKLWSFINEILRRNHLPPVKKRINIKTAYYLGYMIEFFLKSFRIYNVHPPMTRFVALQLGKSHYFSHQNAHNDFNYEPLFDINESLNRI